MRYTASRVKAKKLIRSPFRYTGSIVCGVDCIWCNVRHHRTDIHTIGTLIAPSTPTAALHCPRRCWLDDDTVIEPEPSGTNMPVGVGDGQADDPDANRDLDDPGYQEMPDYDVGDDSYDPD